ncbi:MAG: AAA family ATPase [Desulfobacterales bacterium]
MPAKKEPGGGAAKTGRGKEIYTNNNTPRGAGQASLDNRPLPHSPEIERSIIAACLLSPEMAQQVVYQLDVADFYNHRHQITYRVIQEIAIRGEAAELPVVADRLRAYGHQETVTASYLAGIVDNDPVPADIATSCRILRQKSAERQLIHMCQAVVQGCYEGRGTQELLEHAQAEIAKVTEQIGGGAKDVQSRLITGSELHDHFLKTLSQTWRVGDILPGASYLMVLYGPPGTYKTFIAKDIGLSIAAGIDWHGRPVKQTPVVYIAAEGQAGALKRIESWKRYRGVEAIDDFSLIPVPCLLDEPGDMDALIATLRHLPVSPGLIIIDTLARCMAGDENNTADMGQVIISCGKISQATNAQVMLIHHTGKDANKGARGSIALTGATDTLLLTQKTNDKQVALICERQKDYEPFRDIYFRLDIADTGYVSDDMEPVMSLVPVEDTQARPKKGKANLTGGKRIAYEALKKLYIDDVRVHVDQWRGAAYRAGVSPSSDRGTKQKAFRRAVTSLLNDGYVDCIDDHYRPLE